MTIELAHIGKRFNRQWIFRDISLVFESGECVAVLGGNGSGKSTLLQIISGYRSPSAGNIEWRNGAMPIPADEIYGHISIASPFLQLYDDLTLRENLSFFLKFRSLRNNMGSDDIIARLQLQHHADKPLRNYSSGMKQRVKLALAILSDSSVLLLDEPCSHLDEPATDWYQELLRENHSGRTVFIARTGSARRLFSAREIYPWSRIADQSW